MKGLLLSIFLCTTLCQNVRLSSIQHRDKQVILFPANEEQQLSPFEQQPQPPKSQQESDQYTILKEPPPSKTSDIEEVATRFAWNVFHGSKQHKDSDNLVLSPIMIELMLSTLEKASVDETRRQIQHVIGPFSTERFLRLLHNSKGKSNAVLETASGIFVDSYQQLNRSFVNDAKRTSVDVLSVDFRKGQVTKDLINKWASDATHGTIPRLLSDSYEVKNLELVLATAIYFQSTWKYHFNITEPKAFYTENEVPSTVPFMQLMQNLVYEEINIDNEIRGRFVEIPYENDAYSMVILLPENEYSLDGFIRSLTPEHLMSISKAIRKNTKKLVTLKMPKFEISSRFSVVNSLLKLGLFDIFTLNSKLPYIGVSDDPKVSDILQEAVLKVDEHGTTASAATAALLIPLSADSTDDHTVIVDRPFLSVIFDKTSGVPIFISKIYDP